MKRGRKPKLSIARAKEALEQAGGIRTIAANKLGVHRSTLYNFITAHPSLEAFAEEIVETIGDMAEAQIIGAIRAGDLPTCRWYAELKLKDRGYTRRVETTGPNGGPVEVQQKVDLSKLSEEELEILTRAVERREGIERNVGAHHRGRADCQCAVCQPWPHPLVPANAAHTAS